MNLKQHPNEASVISSEKAVHDLRGIVHPRIKKLSWYIHPHAVSNPSDLDFFRIIKRNDNCNYPIWKNTHYKSIVYYSIVFWIPIASNVIYLYMASQYIEFHM